MSHFTRIKTQMVEKEYLEQALTDMGYECEANTTARGYAGQRTPVEIKVPIGNSGYDIGFIKKNEAYELVADWWGIKGIKKNTFLNNLNQRYAYRATRDKLEAQGFALVSEEVQDGQEIRMTLRRME